MKLAGAGAGQPSINVVRMHVLIMPHLVAASIDVDSSRAAEGYLAAVTMISTSIPGRHN